MAVVGTSVPEQLQHEAVSLPIWVSVCVESNKNTQHYNPTSDGFG